MRVGDERILGDSDFVEQVLQDDILQLDEQARMESLGWDLDGLIARVCTYCDIEPGRLQEKGRENSLSLAKSLICFWGRDKLGIGTSELMAALNISQPAVSKSAKRGANYCRDEVLNMADILE
ncbi:MAG: hypothetical protein AAFZ92_11045 [Pseudomonadota bacterium]